jgi:hypothetical protein
MNNIKDYFDTKSNKDKCEEDKVMIPTDTSIVKDFENLEIIIDTIEKEDQVTEKLINVAHNAMEEHIDRYKVIQLKILNLFNKQFNHKKQIEALHRELFMEMKKTVLLLKDLQLHCSLEGKI